MGRGDTLSIFIDTFIYKLYAQIKLLVLWLSALKRTRNHCTILGLVILDFIHYYSHYFIIIIKYIKKY